jgi:protein-L-isoaspartate(D-aspartate) O-methyltransferase
VNQRYLIGEIMDQESSKERQSDVTALHQAMVDQLKNSGVIRSPGVEEAFRAVPRHLFLPGLPLDQVYRDEAIVTKWQGERAISSSSQPAAMTIMLEQLSLEPGHRVLEIGAGTGFNAAVMAQIVGETGNVTTIDIDEVIVEEAREHLVQAGFGRVEAICGDGGYGYSPSAPYDRIIVTVGAADIPTAWREQLSPDGRIVLPLAIFPDGRQMTFGFAFSDGALTAVSVTHCAFMPLRGAFPGRQPNEDRKVQLGTEPGLLLHLNSDDQREVDPAMIYELLTGPFKDFPTGVEVSAQDLEASFFVWAGFVEPEDGYGSFDCALSAKGEMANRGIVPYLFGLAGKFCSTSGLFKDGSMAVLTRPAEQTPPHEWPKGEPLFELSVRSYGPDLTLAEYLIKQIRDWDAAGRHPDMRRLKVRAYPQENNYAPMADEIIVDRQCTRFIIGR